MLKNKLKQLKKVLGVPEPEIDTELAESNESVVLDIDGIEHDVSAIKEIAVTDLEKEEMQDVIDEGYLQYSAEVVGFDNRELQWDAYRMVASYTDSNSVLDFGCGRGDFNVFWKAESPDRELDYIGVDLNEPLINAGKEVYPDETLILKDWFSLDVNLKQDWAINVGSSNLRYDADITLNDEEYTKKTIQAMYNHCNRGVIVALASKYTTIKDELINHDPGKILNWAKEEFGNVAIDHSMGDDVFVLIIYKV